MGAKALAQRQRADILTSGDKSVRSCPHHGCGPNPRGIVGDGQEAALEVWAKVKNGRGAKVKEDKG